MRSVRHAESHVALAALGTRRVSVRVEGRRVSSVPPFSPSDISYKEGPIGGTDSVTFG